MGSIKGLRRVEAISFCRWNVPEGPDLSSSCTKESFVGVPNLWDAAPVTQSIMGSWYGVS